MNISNKSYWVETIKNDPNLNQFARRILLFLLWSSDDTFSFSVTVSTQTVDWKEVSEATGQIEDFCARHNGQISDSFQREFTCSPGYWENLIFIPRVSRSEESSLKYATFWFSNRELFQKGEKLKIEEYSYTEIMAMGDVF